MRAEIQKLRRTAKSQLKKTDGIIASNEAIAGAVSEVNNALTSNLYALSDGLREFCCGIESGLREIYDKLDLQSKKLEGIKEILEKPLDTQARELRKRAEVAYLNGWIDEAHNDLLEAEKKNYQDFIVHHILGNIYYYHKENYQKALEYYQKAGKYAKPRSKKHAAYSLLCAAMIYYKLNQLPDAYETIKIAAELLPGDPNVLYHYSRYLARMGFEERAIYFLKKTILKDPNYLIASDRDEMFNDIRGEVKILANNFRKEAKEQVNNILLNLETARKKAELFAIDSFNNNLPKIQELCAKNSYFDFIKAKEEILRTFDDFLLEFAKINDHKISALNKAKDNLNNKSKWEPILDYCGGWIYWLMFLPLMLMLTRIIHWGWALVISFFAPILVSRIIRTIAVHEARKVLFYREKDSTMTIEELEKFKAMKYNLKTTVGLFLNQGS